MSADRQRLVVATGNRGKLAEFSDLLAPLGYSSVAQGELGIDGPPEDAVTFLENALTKARHASRLAGLPALADDSGLAVDHLHGAPGVHSARYATDTGAAPGAAAANNAKLLRALDGVPDAQRGACFHCVLVFLRHADDPAPLVAHGQWRGRILTAAQGDAGFGYDPLFLAPEHGVSAAQLDPAEKNRISHRGRAVADLLAQLGGHGAA